MSGPAKVVKTKLFIGNLDPATQPNELSELFASFGNVLEASVIKDYGFVHFGTIEEAEKASVALNNKEFHGKRLRVELSTSTVRHRPGQPEPASALRNSRARAAALASGNGISRYSPAAPMGGIGPIRHSASAWVRSDARPYEGIPMDPNAMAAGYGAPSAAYDRARPYDARSDPRSYYEDRHDGGYAAGYESTGYGNVSGVGSAQPAMYSMRDYRDLPPQSRSDSMSYGGSRVYDRQHSAPPVDPYYAGSLPQGVPPPPAPGDPYHGYSSYPKVYNSRSRESEYSVPSAEQYPPSRAYDGYSNYRNDPYAAASGQPAPARHDPASAYPPSHHPSYSVPNQQRQLPGYAAAPSTQPNSYAPPVTSSYYGAQQRA